MPTQPTAVEGDLTSLIEDAKRLQIAMLPRPRTLSPRVIDLTKAEIRIPESTASLVDGLEPYGS